MNKIGYLTYISIRTYSRRLRVRKEHVGIESKLRTLNHDKSSSKPEEFEYQDLDEFEGDFMNVGHTHVAHEKEQRYNKKILMNRIVASKYFKDEKQPNFLTYIEKQKMRDLHQDDPEMWTSERLSDSFPALPNTINKIIKSNWIQNSADKIIRYDAQVAENWEQFRKGKLQLNESLKNHLMKFKHRKIQMTDRKLLAEQLIPNQEIKFPKPNNTFFSNIMKDYIPAKLDKPIRIANKTNLMLNDPSKTYNSKKVTLSPELSYLGEKKLIRRRQTSDPLSIKNESLDVNPKVISKAGSLQNKEDKGESQLEAKILSRPTKVIPEEKNSSENLQKKKDENRTSLIPLEEFPDDATSSIQNKVASEMEDKILSRPTKVIPEEKSLQKFIQTKSLSENLQNKKDENRTNLSTQNQLVEFQMETQIVSRQSKVDYSLEYMYYLQIPRKLYKKGMTYRVENCYYDDDGQFLYKIPAIKY